MAPKSTRRADLAAALAGILIGGLAAAGAVSAAGGGPHVVTCSQAGTGAVATGVDCGPGGVEAIEGSRAEAAR